MGMGTDGLGGEGLGRKGWGWGGWGREDKGMEGGRRTEEEERTELVLPSIEVRRLYEVSISISPVQGIGVKVNCQGINVLEVGSDKVFPS